MKKNPPRFGGGQVQGGEKTIIHIFKQGKGKEKPRQNAVILALVRGSSQEEAELEHSEFPRVPVHPHHQSGVNIAEKKP